MNFCLKSSIFFYVLYLCLMFDLGSSFKCSHVPPKEEDIIRGVVMGNVREGKHQKREANDFHFHPMQFTVTYHEESFKALDSKLADYVRHDLIQKCTKFWTRILNVSSSTTAATVLNRRQNCENPKCGEVVIPDDQLNACGSKPKGKGIVTDFFLYVSAVNTATCSRTNSTLAYAQQCESEIATQRPVAGYMNLCPHHLSLEPRLKDDIISTIKHEMLHTMGFSSSRWNEFRNIADGRTWNETIPGGVLVSANLTWWTRHGLMNHTVTYLRTPSLQNASRQYFGCNTLIGAELENQGGNGTIGTHFEKRIFENEAMTGVSSHNSVYSVMTLALLKDTGWYMVDMTKAEKLVWGHKLGCDFVHKSCGEWIKNHLQSGKPLTPFCGVVNEPFSPKVCTLDRLSVSHCNLQKLDKEIPEEYQYFDSSIMPNVPEADLGFYGGTSEVMDYCPYHVGFNWIDRRGTVDRDSKCTVEKNEGRGLENYPLETTGKGSRCMESGQNKLWILRHCDTPRRTKMIGAGCYPYLCKNGSLWFTLLNGTVEKRCMKKDHVIQIRRVDHRWLHTGSVLCPDCTELCDKSECTHSYTGSVSELYMTESDLQARILCRSSSVYGSIIFICIRFSLLMLLTNLFELD